MMSTAHQLPSGRWLVATYRDGRYERPLTARERRLTGCHTVFGPLSYVTSGAPTYARKRDAMRAARRQYGEE